MIGGEGRAQSDAMASGWSRQELTLRLSRRRLAKLKGIAASLPAGSTPTDAIDHAIDCARFAPADYSDHLAEIGLAIDAEAERSRLANERLESKIHALAASVEALRALIAAVALDENS